MPHIEKGFSRLRPPQRGRYSSSLLTSAQANCFDTVDSALYVE
jgi:hypothetical protein